MKRNKIENNESELTGREAMVMRCIWNHGKDISSLEIKQKLEMESGIVFERTTVATYLLHLQEKGFIKRYKSGQVYYYRPLRKKEQFVGEEAKKTTERWFDGSLPAFVAAFIGSGAEISAEDLQKVKEIINGLNK